VQVLCREDGRSTDQGAFLRRPFSLAGARREGNRTIIELIYRQVGRGTAWLDQCSRGDQVDLIGPLGNGFSLELSRKTAYLVAGGVGHPPLLMLAEELAARKIDRLAFCGARSADALPLSINGEVIGEVGPGPITGVREWAVSATPVIISTDDGSAGFAGSVVEALEGHLAAHHVDTEELAIFACGPAPMLAAVASIARRLNVPCQVAVERMMACGMGTCQSCVVRVRAGDATDGWRYKLCCKDGPVFPAEEVLW
jgi:dihydroorotate dehydrogenase electron transfer subunit